MPTIDTASDTLVVRIVYDGPPFSGKTTSLRALARSLGVRITTPAEADGRTLFFDWIDYVGGLFEGRKIRCQIVSVPGQHELAARRSLLLEQADAVVLVADTRRSHMGEALSMLASLLPRCRAEDPPVGIVVQANKRDAPDSVPAEELRARFGAVAPLAVIETVASHGGGIREAFVFGVRLALDRVRALSAAGELSSREVTGDAPEDLLRILRELQAGDRVYGSYLDAQPAGTPSATGGEDRSDAPAASVSGITPTAAMPTLPKEDGFVADASMPGGFIWPPVDGRTLLHEVAKLGIDAKQNSNGDWFGAGHGCQIHSGASAIYAGADAGRGALIEWARLHASSIERISQGRAVILCPTGTDAHRLWQLVRSESSLHESLAVTAEDIQPSELARRVMKAAQHLLRARDEVHTAELPLPCTLRTISGDTRLPPRFVGLMPHTVAPLAAEPEGLDLLRRELMPWLHGLSELRADVPSLLEVLMSAGRHTGIDTVTAWLAELAGDVSPRSARTGRTLPPTGMTG